MKKDRAYLIFTAAAIAIFVLYQLAQKQATDWTTTFHHRDKSPFGAELVHELMPDLFMGKPVPSVFRTVYELVETDTLGENLLIVTQSFSTDKNDFNAMVRHAQQGFTILVAAYNFGGALADSLNISTWETIRLRTLNSSSVEQILGQQHSDSITFTQSKKSITVPSLAATGYFTEVEDSNLEVLAEDAQGNPVLMRWKVGEGSILLCSTPLAFTNYMVMDDQAYKLTEHLLNYFPENIPVVHNEYYHLGRLESSTPLRVLLRDENLRAATYIMLIGFLLFLLFGTKRKQRLIPVIGTLQNTSLEFTQTLGRLYYRQRDHRKLAEKRMKYWVDYIYRRYNLRPLWNAEFIELLAQKSGADLKVCQRLVELFKQVETGASVSNEHLMKIENTLNEFYGIE